MSVTVRSTGPCSAMKNASNASSRCRMDPPNQTQPEAGRSVDSNDKALGTGRGRPGVLCLLNSLFDRGLDPGAQGRADEFHVEPEGLGRIQVRDQGILRW